MDSKDDKANVESLPDGWMLCKSKSTSGRIYYFNKKNGKSSWTRPQVEKVTANVENKRQKLDIQDKQQGSNKVLKRKCAPSDEGYVEKKAKKDNPIPIPQKISIPQKPTSKSSSNKSKQEEFAPHKPGTRYDSSSRQTFNGHIEKRKTSKNIASARLMKLRAQLDAEVREEALNNDKNCRQKKSPNTTQSEMRRNREQKTSSTETKCSSPTNNDSVHFAQSLTESQFFAANKIISSMKAQLPEEYTNKLKPKDSYADIEQGICNQNAEYSVKHPSTPPQFSEATKLMTAIKSKLAYRGSEVYTSAKDRMESFRSRLHGDLPTGANNEVHSVKNVHTVSGQEIENMEVDLISENFPPTENTRGIDKSVNKDDPVLVVDTNIFIHNLGEIKHVINSHIKGYSGQPHLLVPWRVINELDRLKDNNNGNGVLCKRARAAMDYLYTSLPEDNRIKGQSLRDSNSHIYPCELPDDEILNCCLQQLDRGKSVVLLSNDKNLSNKAFVNGVKCVGMVELKELLVKNGNSNEDAKSNLHGKLVHYKSAMHRLLANILENEMRAMYNKLWENVVIKRPPWSLDDVLMALNKHWTAVFSDVFPRIQHLFIDMRNRLAALDEKDPNSLFESEIRNFKELCLEIAKKCQIIPEYLDLAKNTVEKITLGPGEERPSRPVEQGTSLQGGYSPSGVTSVINIFETLWTAFSSYCEKVSSTLGADNNMPNNNLPELGSREDIRARLDVFIEHVNKLTDAIKQPLIHSSTEANTKALQKALADSLNVVNIDGHHQHVDLKNLEEFCFTRREMLQEACMKFTQLLEGLHACKNKVHDVNN